MISDEGIDLDENRSTNHPIERPAPVAVRSPPRKKTVQEQKLAIDHGLGSVFGETLEKPPEDSIFEFVGQEDGGISHNVESHDNFYEMKILDDCKFTDLAFHFAAPGPQQRA